MSQLMIKWCLAIAVIVAALFAIAPRSEATPPTAVAANAEIDIPDQLRIAPAACTFLTCFQSCNAQGFCEGSCIAGICRCRFPRGPGQQCP